MSALREGFTTGSCAAAAALACCLRLESGACPGQVNLTLPGGQRFSPEVICHGDGSCGVTKFSGDDPDITDGVEVVCRVTPLHHPGAIEFAAGEGVGTITLPGLKLPVGEAAINPVPRQMIAEAVRSVLGEQAARVEVSIPGGAELAKRTFNPRLGVVGGLSILGTSGIVRPMSEEALKESLRLELSMHAAQGHAQLMLCFGNQGELALERLFPAYSGRIVQMSNFAGFMLDGCEALGIRRVLVGGHPGKLCKLAAGCMHTHSALSDGRREAIVTQLALLSAPLSLMQAVYDSATTEAAIELIARAGYARVWDPIADAAARACSLRVHGALEVDALVLDGAGERLGASRSLREEADRWNT